MFRRKFLAASGAAAILKTMDLSGLSTFFHTKNPLTADEEKLLEQFNLMIQENLIHHNLSKQTLPYIGAKPSVLKRESNSAHTTTTLRLEGNQVLTMSKTKDKVVFRIDTTKGFNRKSILS